MSMLSPEIDPPAGQIGGRKADRAYEYLKRAILLRRLEPDQQLLEQTLAGEFACSQGTVREALLRLGEDGLVERRGYQGTFVTGTSLAEAAEMVRVRLSIERSVARSLAETGVEHDKAAIEAILAAMDTAHAAGDLYLCSQLDRQFHARLATSAGMGLLAPILRRCALHIHRFTLGGLEVPREFFQESGIGDEHRELLAELTSGSAPRAEAAVTAHLARVLTRWSPSLIAATRDAFDTRKT